ncbi:nucleotide exchange factor GrpE [Thermoflavimicrobium dichotomicum]|uniref:Protein GrpE n=1 Tax=Thermoflavimicrobium dichotomicum TaxID=46223 RepID=A0A1I3NJB8_9BACL|nr:nucleotide exchange factor GrpE [Thermoflavimicrobium dichotomicum]SFJ09403.1 molecular chaperone GrpE [Thermoflavimicrobium dichotomicum]
MAAKKRKRKRIRIDADSLQATKILEHEEVVHTEMHEQAAHMEENVEPTIANEPMPEQEPKLGNQPILGNTPIIDEEKDMEMEMTEERLAQEEAVADHKEVTAGKEEVPEETQDISEEVVVDPTIELQKEIESLKQKLSEYETLTEELQQKLAEMHEKLLMSHADLENFRRRARKDKEDALKYASVPLIESLLPVLDNFERALDAADKSLDAEGLKQGVEMVYRQFLQVLSQAGLTLIEAEGKPFNPHEHNAVMQVESDQYEPGMVVEELQPGYRYKDRVIRPSMVKVSS